MLNRRTLTGALLALLALLVLSASAEAARKKSRAPSKAAKPAPASVVDEPEADEPEPQPQATASIKDEPAPTSRGPARIDFDDRLIQGQTNKSGAVYLYDRKELSVRSMVDRRKSFRDQIIRDVLAE